MLEVLVTIRDRDNHDKIKGEFEKLGMNVHMIASFSSAIDFLAVRNLDFVFVDFSCLSTPRPDLVQKLNQLTKAKKVHLIIMATAEERARLRGTLPFHEADVVVKPVTAETLSKKLVQIRPGEFKIPISNKS